MPTGGCLCGEIQYEITGEPKNIVACHCIPCRMTSSTSNSINLMIPNEHFKLISGTPKTFSRKGKSGKNVTYNSCNTCPTICFVDAEAMEGMKVVKAGTVKDQDYFHSYGPTMEIFTTNRAPWCTAFEQAKQMG